MVAFGEFVFVQFVYGGMGFGAGVDSATLAFSSDHTGFCRGIDRSHVCHINRNDQQKMMDFYYKEVDNYLPVIQDCFKTDQELIDKWHVEAPATLDKCVRRTFADLHNCESLKMFELRSTSDDTDELAGFFGTEYVYDKKIEEHLSFLTSFFVKPKYRTRDFMDFFWTCVELETKENFFTAIYSGNIRAQKFLEKKGMKLIETKEIGNNKSALIFSN